jgi:nitrate reductase gamma subunit
MNLILFLQIVTGLALAFFILAFGQRLRTFIALARPVDRSPLKGDPKAGQLYAFTLGMMPWAKESTRLHFIAYTRGVLFHLGIFLGLALLLASPWIPAFPVSWRIFLAVCTGFGALFGLVGFVARFVEHNLRALSTPDDYFAVLVMTLWLASATLWLALPETAWGFYLCSVIMLVYAPFSKIRHCMYYAFSRIFFGRFVGGRAVLPHQQQAHSH